MAAEVADFLAHPASQLPARFTMNRVRFPFNSPKLNTEAFEQVDDLVKILEAHPGSHIEFVGHIDGAESDPYTGPYGDGAITLSAIRARCLYKKLAARGVAAERMGFRGLGSSEPGAGGDPRRLEVVVIRR